MLTILFIKVDGEGLLLGAVNQREQGVGNEVSELGEGYGGGGGAKV